MGLFDKLKNLGKDKPSPRVLSHAKDLVTGDVVNFGFSSLESLNNSSAQIGSINTFDISETLNKTVFKLDTTSKADYLAVIKDRDDEKLELSRVIHPDDVDKLFTFGQFSNVFDQDQALSRLDTKNTPAHLSGWTAEAYFLEASHEIYLYQGDYRTTPLPGLKSDATALDYYLFVSQDRKHALQIEVFDENRTDVLLIAYQPLHFIEAMWPAKQSMEE